MKFSYPEKDNPPFGKPDGIGIHFASEEKIRKGGQVTPPIPDMIQTPYVADAMSKYGGGFMNALAGALVRADVHNERKIIETWREDIERSVKLWWEFEGSDLGNKVYKF